MCTSEGWYLVSYPCIWRSLVQKASLGSTGLICSALIMMSAPDLELAPDVSPGLYSQFSIQCKLLLLPQDSNCNSLTGLLLHPGVLTNAPVGVAQ